MFKVELRANLKAKDDLERLIKSIRTDVIENGLDKTLSQDLEVLRTNLRNIVNKAIRTEIDIQDKKDPKEQKINIPKSDEEIIKMLTGFDLTKFAKTKDFSTMTDAGIVMKFDRQADSFKVNQSTAHPMSSGVNIRMPMGALSTFEAQQSAAYNFFNQSMFIIEERGKLTYYLNPGINMSQYIKIVCSNQAGDNQRSRDKFDQHAQRRGYADWTLLAEGLEVVKKNFINLNDVVDRIKEGDIEEAARIMNHHAGPRAHNSLKYVQTIEDLRQNKGVQPSTQAYLNIVNLVKNMKIHKRITKEKVTYTVVSTFNDDQDYGDFFQKMDTALSIWKITNHRRWFNSLVTETEKAIRKITG
jgi:hypothetical protein